MPATQQVPWTLFNAVAPVVAGSSTPQDGLYFDHLQLFIKYLKGTSASTVINPDFSIDGTTWYSVYDAAQTAISHTYAADATVVLLYGSNNTNSRMQPLPFCVPLWRLTLAVTGTTTSSSITIYSQPYTLGGTQD